MRLTAWMATAPGRGLRSLFGALLVGVGLALGGAAGLVVALVGVIPLLAGMGNVCLLGPVLGAPLRGGRARSY